MMTISISSAFDPVKARDVTSEARSTACSNANLLSPTFGLVFLKLAMSLVKSCLLVMKLGDFTTEELILNTVF